MSNLSRYASFVSLPLRVFFTLHFATSTFSWPQLNVCDLSIPKQQVKCEVITLLTKSRDLPMCQPQLVERLGVWTRASPPSLLTTSPQLLKWTEQIQGVAVSDTPHKVVNPSVPALWVPWRFACPNKTYLQRRHVDDSALEVWWSLPNVQAATWGRRLTLGFTSGLGRRLA